MLGFLFPRPPVETGEKVWVERGLDDLARVLGADRLRSAEHLSPAAVLAGYEPTEGHARGLFERFARHAGLDPAAVELRLPWESERGETGDGPGDGPGDERGKTPDPPADGAAITVPRRLLADGPVAAAVLVHQLCRRVPADRTGPPASAADAGPRADLCAAALGLGLFGANAALAESSAAPPGAGDGWWAVGKGGFLTAREFGYALGLLAWVRDGPVPHRGELRPDAGQAADAGLRYVRKTGDCLFTPESFGTPVASRTGADVRADLRSRRPGVRLAALADLADRAELTPESHAAAWECLRDADRDVRVFAARTLVAHPPAAGGDAGADTLLELARAADDDAKRVRVAVLRVLAAVPGLPNGGAAFEELRDVMNRRLVDRDEAVRSAAFAALPAFGPAASQFAPAVLKAVTKALVDCRDRPASEAAAVLTTLVPDAAAFVRERLGDDELETRTLGLLGGPSAPPETDDPAAAGAQ